MKIDPRQRRLPSQHGASRLYEKEPQTTDQSSNEYENNSTSSNSPQADVRRSKQIEGQKKFSRLGWKRLVILLIVEAVALGSLSLPKSFMSLGMVGGVICSVGIGLIATYASYEVGAVKIKHPEIEHYGDIGRLILGEKGFWIITVVFIFQLVLSVGSHCLTGIIALSDITRSDVCNVVFGMTSALIMLLLAIPPTFADIAILGYIDVVSIFTAIGITIIATGVQKSQQKHISAQAEWSAWPPEGTDFATAMVAINNIVFAYSFAPAIPSFVNEMHTPEDYSKAIYALGFIEIILYTLIGSLVYSFVGMDVQSPALLSAGPLLSRVAFGVALPVIFISGSINTNIVARYIHTHVYRDSVLRYVNTRMGWVTWCLLVTILTLLSWVVAEAIPVFSLLLSISASLFNSGLCFYIPSIMWFVLVKEGSCFSRRNIQRSICNGIVFLFGIIVLVAGLYGTIVDLIRETKNASFGRPFTCAVIT